jgi:hypothetical protein
MTKKDKQLIWEAYNESVLEGQPFKEPDWETEWDKLYAHDPFEPNELKMGIEVEMEHTDDSNVAEQIARDHLAENPTYYTDLKNCETQIGKKL